MLQDAHTARISLKAINDVVDEANWLGGGSGMP
jgi:hypothetical protein